MDTLVLTDDGKVPCLEGKTSVERQDILQKLGGEQLVKDSIPADLLGSLSNTLGLVAPICNPSSIKTVSITTGQSADATEGVDVHGQKVTKKSPGYDVVGYAWISSEDLLVPYAPHLIPDTANKDATNIDNPMLCEIPLFEEVKKDTIFFLNIFESALLLSLPVYSFTASMSKAYPASSEHSGFESRSCYMAVNTKNGNMTPFVKLYSGKSLKVIVEKDAKGLRDCSQFSALSQKCRAYFIMMPTRDVLETKNTGWEMNPVFSQKFGMYLPKSEKSSSGNIGTAQSGKTLRTPAIIPRPATCATAAAFMSLFEATVSSKLIHAPSEVRDRYASEFDSFRHSAGQKNT